MLIKQAGYRAIQITEISAHYLKISSVVKG